LDEFNGGINHCCTDKQRAGSCTGDFSVLRSADVLCGDRSNAVLGW